MISLSSSVYKLRSIVYKYNINTVEIPVVYYHYKFSVYLGILTVEYIRYVNLCRTKPSVLRCLSEKNWDSNVLNMLK